VLVGGRSSRMGRDKARLRYRGGALAEWVARQVQLAAQSATLVGNRVGDPTGDLTSDPELGGIPDLYPGEGPLGGILTALHHSLQHTAADWNLIVARDMPEVSAAFLEKLLAAAEASGADALLPAGPSGRVEPLCAVYHRRALAPMELHFTRGVRKVAAALEGVPTFCLSVTELAPFQNVNTPEDWAGYAAG
jgi:molybdopterin-guanine dinucleotide biosynthesis protein A